jgi:ring-1,2-phenylacetyl-CoA epoxidase subunit PaaA
MNLPDPDLKWNEERGHFDFGEIDWDEFKRSMTGGGPCSRQRVAHHIQAHEEGAWVREAMRAYREKQKARDDQAAA